MPYFQEGSSTWIRLITAVLYIVFFLKIRMYAQNHPPRFKGEYVEESKSLVMVALWRMWGLLLWPLPGLMWVGMMPIPALIIASFSFLIPLSIFLVFFKLAGVCNSHTYSVQEELSSWMIPGIPIFLILLTVLQLIQHPFPILRFMVFLIFITFPPVLAVLALVWTVNDVIAVDNAQPRRTFYALQNFIGFFTALPKPSWIVADGEVKMRIKGSPFYGVGSGWLLTEPENLVVLKDSAKIRRVVGPGTLFTETAESPHQVIDLRNQIRITRINAHTRDGVEVNLIISSLFRIYPGSKEITLESLSNREPWPFRNKRDIFQIILHEGIDGTGIMTRVHTWDDLPLKAVVNRVKQIISCYKLEQLYGVNPETGNLIRTDISIKVLDAMREAVAPLGLEILSGRIVEITPTNPNIIKQRLKVWQANRRARISKAQTNR